jgi:hypothetical protein
MKKSFLFLAALIILSQGCSYVVRYDGTYSGKVVDADTREPIEGAVVLGTWYTVAHTVAGGVHSYYDARETETDRNGEFSIPGMGLRIMSNFEPMNFLIFKSGYEYIGSAHWESLKVDELLSKRIKWEGNKPVIPLKKLTTEERRKSGTFPATPPTEATLDKVRLMLREINKEAIERGLEPIDIWRGERL